MENPLDDYLNSSGDFRTRSEVHKYQGKCAAVQKRLSEIDWDFPSSGKGASIHNIHPYPAKFIREIPSELIRVLNPPKTAAILDPFCGSGVSLVEAQRAGYRSVGIDLNPIACLISEVKTIKLSKTLPQRAASVIERASSLSGTAQIPSIPNLDHWFKNEIQEEVASIVMAIKLMRASNATKKALRLALSSILVRTSKQESDTRYAAIEKSVKREDVAPLFMKAAQKIAKMSYANNDSPSCDIINKDLMSVTADDINDDVGLVVTSPPYPNAYEYWLYHKYRMFWLGYDPIAVRKSEIGARAHYFKKNRPTEEDFRIQMRHMLSLSKDVLIKNGFACVVIGRSKVHGEIIDNASIIKSEGEDLGYKFVSSIPRNIASARKSFNLSHAAIAREHIVILQNRGR